MSDDTFLVLALIAGYFFVIIFLSIEFFENSSYLAECDTVCVAEGWDSAEKLARTGIDENLCHCVRINEMNHRENANFARWK